MLNAKDCRLQTRQTAACKLALRLLSRFQYSFLWLTSSMSLFAWLFRQSRFERIPDCFSLTRQFLWQEIVKGTKFQQAQGKSVWVVTHFPNQYLAAQDVLAQAGIEYQILPKSVDPIEIAEMARDRPGMVSLALAEQLNLAVRSDQPIDHGLRIAMIVIERHPSLHRDLALEDFARLIMCPVIFGYYLALDDPVIAPHMSPPLLQFLKQYGMGESELVHSLIITKSLDRALKKLAGKYDESRQANSAEEWLSEPDK